MKNFHNLDINFILLRSSINVESEMTTFSYIIDNNYRMANLSIESIKRMSSFNQKQFFSKKNHVFIILVEKVVTDWKNVLKKFLPKISY